jgi:hypothetical protein
MNEKQLKKAFDGWVFSLGWWPHSAAPSDDVTSSRGHESITTIGETIVEESQESCHSGRTSESTFRTVTMPSNDGKRFGVDIGKASAFY